jgi:hypothetical protein
MGAEVQLGRVCEYPPVQTGYKNAPDNDRHLRHLRGQPPRPGGRVGNGHDRGNAAIRARLISIVRGR